MVCIDPVPYAHSWLVRITRPWDKHSHCICYLRRSVRKETEDVLDLMSVLMHVLYPLMILVSVVM